MGTKKSHFFRDTNIMLGRSMKHIFRSIDTIITVCITPIAIMLLMVYVSGGAMGGGMSTAEYVSYSLPGILLISISSAIAYTALRLFTDIKSGFFDRFKSMPISASSALWAHVLTSLVSNAMSLAVIFLVAFFMGFRSSSGMFNWLAVIGILALFTFGTDMGCSHCGLKSQIRRGFKCILLPTDFFTIY